MPESDADTADDTIPADGDAVSADDDAVSADDDAVPADDDAVSADDDAVPVDDDAVSTDDDDVDRYVCSVCRATTERAYGVRYIVTTCPDCGRHGRLVHESLVALVERVPESERPDDWADRPLEERILDALQRGFISLGDTNV